MQSLIIFKGTTYPIRAAAHAKEVKILLMQRGEQLQPLLFLLLLFFSKIMLCLGAFDSFSTGFYPQHIPEGIAVCPDLLLPPLCLLTPNSPVRPWLRCRFPGHLSRLGLLHSSTTALLMMLRPLARPPTSPYILCSQGACLSCPLPCPRQPECRLAHSRCSVNAYGVRLRERDWRMKYYPPGFRV